MKRTDYRECPACGGRRRIALLTSTVSCGTCRGTGLDLNHQDLQQAIESFVRSEPLIAAPIRTLKLFRRHGFETIADIVVALGCDDKYDNHRRLAICEEQDPTAVRRLLEAIGAAVPPFQDALVARHAEAQMQNRVQQGRSDA